MAEMPIASYRAYVCGYPIPIVIGAIARPEFCRAVPQQVELRVESTALVYRSCLNIGGVLNSYMCCSLFYSGFFDYIHCEKIVRCRHNIFT